MATEQEWPEPVECKGTGERKPLMLIWDDEYELTEEELTELEGGDNEQG